MDARPHLPAVQPGRNQDPAEEIYEKIKSLRRLDRYSEIHSLLASCEPDILSNVRVACEGAAHYLQIGRLDRAARSVRAANLAALRSSADGLLHMDVALLALISAQIDMKRDLAFAGGLSLIREIEDIYIHLQLPNDISKESRSLVESIANQASAWELEDTETLASSGLAVSDTRLYIEQRLVLLHFAALENGYLSLDETRLKLRDRYTKTCKILRQRQGPDARKLESDWLRSTFKDPAVDALDPPLHFVHDLMRDLNGNDMEYANLTMALMSPDPRANQDAAAASGKLQTCQEIYRLNGCALAATLGIEWAKLVLQPAGPLKLSQYRNFSEKWLVNRHVENFWTAAYKAILETYKSNDQWNEFCNLEAFIRPVLEKAQNRLYLQELEICHWSSRASASTSTIADIEEAANEVKGFLQRSSGRMTPKTEAGSYRILQQCFERLQRYREAKDYAEKDVGSLLSQRSYYYQSQAFRHLALHRHQLITQTFRAEFHSQREKDKAWREAYTQLMERIEELEKYAETDHERNAPDLRQEKCELLFQYLNTIIIRFPEKKSEALAKREHWFQELEKGPNDSVIRTLARATMAQQSITPDRGIAAADAQLLHSQQNDVPAPRLAEMQSLCAVTRRSKYLLLGVVMDPTDRTKLLEEILFYLRQALETLATCARTSLTLTQVSNPYFDTVFDYISSVPEKKASCLHDVQDFLQTAEAISNNRRNTYLNRTGMMTVLNSRQDESNVFQRALYHEAANFYLKLGESDLAWTWNQKSRGRALLTMLSRDDTTTSEATSNLVTENSKAMESLMEQDEDLVTRSLAEDHASSDATDRSQRLRTELTNHVPALAELFQITTTDDILDREDLDQLFSAASILCGAKRKVVLVDWCVSKNDDITMLVLDSKFKKVSTRRLDIKLFHVRKWIQENFESGFNLLKGDYCALEPLSGLIDGLDVMTDPDDLLVLSPPSPISAVPIHGIVVESESLTLIQRNPVIYNTSTSLYKKCLERSVAVQASDGERLKSAAFTALYEDGQESRAVAGDRPNSVYKSVEGFAQLFNSTRIVTGHNLDRVAFIHALRTASWVHFHGHGEFADRAPLAQAYILSETPDRGNLSATSEPDELGLLSHKFQQASLTSSANDGAGSAGPKTLQVPSPTGIPGADRATAGDILTLDMRRHAPFVCSIACDSAVQDVAPGDEPLGLVAALFIAGASTVLGTLWAIRSSCGQKFAELFYADIRLQLAAPGVTPAGRRYLNLAAAFRAATVELMQEADAEDEFGAPYFWAGFGLYGSGIFFL